MNRRPATRPRCPGSGQDSPNGRFPGDSDRCPVCSRDHVRVLESGTLAAHEPGKGPRRREYGGR